MAPLGDKSQQAWSATGVAWVGVYIAPGAYRSEGSDREGDFCSFERLKEAGGGDDLDNSIDFQLVPKSARRDDQGNDGGFSSRGCKP